MQGGSGEEGVHDGGLGRSGQFLTKILSGWLRGIANKRPFTLISLWTDTSVSFRTTFSESKNKTCNSVHIKCTSIMTSNLVMTSNLLQSFLFMYTHMPSHT